MKLMIAIVNKKDSRNVCDALRDDGLFFTKVSTSGGFLRDGNDTLLLGLEDELVDKAIAIIKKHSAKRMELVPDMPSSDGSFNAFTKIGAEVVVGGATVFVTDVEKFEKI